MLQVVIADVGDKDSSYEDFLSVLPPSDCRYGGMAMFSSWSLAEVSCTMLMMFVVYASDCAGW